jgi:DNA-binding MarR family transcriptional regulator
MGSRGQDTLKPHWWKVKVLHVEALCGYHASRQWPGDDKSPSPSAPVGEKEGTLDATQKRILDYISSHPGVHLRQVCRELGLAMGDVQYHTNRLEKGGRIASTRRGFYRFFYPSTLFGEKQRDTLSVLALDTPRELLLTIVEKPGASQEELARAVGVSQPTASWHLRRLAELGIVQREQRGRSMVYSLAGTSPIEIATFIRNYHPSSWERWSSRLADIFISYSVKEDAGDKK